MKRKKTDDQDFVVDSGLTLPENIKSHNLVDIEKDYFNELDKLDRKNNKSLIILLMKLIMCFLRRSSGAA